MINHFFYLTKIYNKLKLLYLKSLWTNTFEHKLFLTIDDFLKLNLSKDKYIEKDIVIVKKISDTYLIHWKKKIS